MADLSDQRDFQAICLEIFHATLDPGRWSLSLDHLSAICNKTRYTLLASDPVHPGATIALDANGDPSFLDSYIRDYQHLNVWAEHWTKASLGKVIASGANLPIDHLRKTDFYNGWLKPQEDLLGGVGLILSRQAGSTFLLAATIRARELDRREAQCDRWLAALAPYLHPRQPFARRHHRPRLLSGR